MTTGTPGFGYLIKQVIYGKALRSLAPAIRTRALALSLNGVAYKVMRWCNRILLRPKRLSRAMQGIRPSYWLASFIRPALTISVRRTIPMRSSTVAEAFATHGMEPMVRHVRDTIARKNGGIRRLPAP